MVFAIGLLVLIPVLVDSIGGFKMDIQFSRVQA